MISKTEIKKQGWKPVPKKDKNELDMFTMKVHGRSLHLRMDEPEIGGKICISEFAPEALKNLNPLTAMSTLFYGHIPKRYELQIIMRCLGIG